MTRRGGAKAHRRRTRARETVAPSSYVGPMTTTETPTDTAPGGEPAADQPGGELAPFVPPDEMTASTLAYRTLGLPSVQEWQAISSMANALARSNLVPRDLVGKPDDVAVILLYGRDLRLPTSVALSKVHVVKGRPGLAGETMLALIRREGHKVWPAKSNDDEQATVHARRRDSDETVSFTFTIDDAARAGLVRRQDDGTFAAPKKQGDPPPPWDTYRPDMLWWRAVARMARQQFSEVLAGMTYTPEEIEEGWDVIEANATEDVEYVPASEDPQERPISANAVDAWRRRIVNVATHDALLVSWLRGEMIARGMMLVDKAGAPVLRRNQLDEFSRLVENAEGWAADVTEPHQYAQLLVDVLAGNPLWVASAVDAAGSPLTPPAPAETSDEDAPTDTSSDAAEPPAGAEGSPSADGAKLWADDDPGRPFTD